jgi:hypothetical protein
VRRAIGISVHTGWGACVVVSGSLQRPEIVENRLVELSDDPERFCFHRAAEMDPALAQAWLTDTRAKMLDRARAELAPLLQHVVVGAIVAKLGDVHDLDRAMASHMRIHSAEGFFYRDVFREACGIACRIIPPTSLEIAAAGKLHVKPWGRDQKLAALAAWQALSR